MQVQLYDIKLIVPKLELVSVKILQGDQLLFNLESKSKQTQIRILLEKIINNIPLTFKINQFTVEQPLEFLEEGRIYKLNLQNTKLEETVISKHDIWCIGFKYRFIMPFLPNKDMNDSQLQHKLIENGKGTSEYQSCSSLRHSIPEISFCKAPRFDKSTTLQTEFNYKLSESVSSRAPSFGYGNKYICPIYVQRNAEQNPGPDAYFQPNLIQPKNIRKTVWSQSDRFKLSIDQLPGPAQYEVDKKIGEDKPSISIGVRCKPLATFQESVPGPNNYEIRASITQPSRFNKISLGYGNKTSFCKNDNTPGPGTYEQPSIFKSSSQSILNNGSQKASIMK